MKKLFTLSLSFLFTFQILSYTTFASSLVDTSINQSKEVIAIVDGIEITKDDIDENGLINNDVFLHPSESKESSIITYGYSIPSVLTVQKGRNALMIKLLKAPTSGFSQQTDIYYLTPSSAKTFAYKLTSSSNLSIVGQGIIAVTLGYITNPHVGTFYTIASMLQGLSMNSVKNSILNLANNNKSVQVKVIKPSNGPTLYSVNEWNGTTIYTNLTNTSNASEYVHYYKTSN